MKVNPGMGKNRIKMITSIDLTVKRIEDLFDEADFKAYSTVLDCFVDSFLTQADTLPPDFLPTIARARLTSMIEQINKIGSKHKDPVNPNELISKTLQRAEQKRNEKGEVGLKTLPRKSIST